MMNPAYHLARMREVIEEHEPSRERSLAATKLDECEMWLARCTPTQEALQRDQGGAVDGGPDPRPSPSPAQTPRQHQERQQMPAIDDDLYRDSPDAPGRQPMPEQITAVQVTTHDDEPEHISDGRSFAVADHILTVTDSQGLPVAVYAAGAWKSAVAQH